MEKWKDGLMQAIGSLQMEEVNEIQSVLDQRKRQLIQQRILSVPLYSWLPFRVNEGELSQAVTTGQVVGHARRSLTVRLDDGSQRKVDYSSIPDDFWRKENAD